MFQKAQRKSVKIKIAITGPSGSGKTFSALKLAKGMGGKIAVIDTENGSASLYSDLFDFDVVELQPPFTPEKYIQAIEAAEKARYDILIIDSLSHEWDGEGGLLQMKESLDARPGGNSYTNWGKMNKPHTAFTNAYLHSNMNIIATLRSKQDYILEANDKGKQVPKKVGLKPIQREGSEYEFTTVFDIAMTHEATVSKDRTNLFVDKFFKINEETGTQIRDWLNSVPAATPAPIDVSVNPVRSITGPALNKGNSEAAKTLDATSRFNQDCESFMLKIEEKCKELMGEYDVDTHLEKDFRHEFFKYLKEEYIKANGKIDFDALFVKTLTAKRLTAIALNYNAGRDKGLTDSELHKLKTIVYNEFFSKVGENLVEIFNRHAQQFN